MNYQIYQVDAFTENILGGNPACVIPLEKWFSDDLLLQIAKENAVAETAFFIINDDHIHLRWFTPDIEIDLCGHATLATACVLKKILNYPPKFIRFKTLSGDLKVSYKNDMFFLDLPSRPGIPSELPNEISSALNIQPKEIFKARDYMLVYDSEEEVKSIQINRLFFDKINSSCNFFMSLAIASGCSNSEPFSSNLSAYRGSSLFFDINQKFFVLFLFLKFIFKISEYFCSIISISSSTVLSVGILKYLSSSELIFLMRGLTISSNGSIIIETIYSIVSSQVSFSNHK